jgi:pimeloyl-ACP methyl ester carboxylesterase
MRQTRRTGGPVAIAYDIKGNGPLVVFLHGIDGNRLNWEGQVGTLERSFVRWHGMRGVMGPAIIRHIR